MTPRPYRLFWTEHGILGEVFGTYSAPENAWKAFDKLWAEASAKKLTSLYNGWFMVIGPNDFVEYVAVGRCVGRALPLAGNAKERIK